MWEIIIGVAVTLLALLGVSTTNLKLKKRKIQKLEQEIEEKQTENEILEYEQKIAESIDSHIVDARERERMRANYQREAQKPDAE